MLTKEDLQQAKASVNEALLKIKQVYSNSSTSKKVLFVVEGKDDVPYYGTKADEYIPDGWKLSIIPARNRKKVVEAYRKLDWTVFSKEKVIFFIDRDLADYTGEDTPIDSNVYVTSKYAIENELCTVSTYIKALKYYYDLVEINEIDEEKLKTLYTSCWLAFTKIVEPLMAQILYWKMNGVKSNYSNYKIQNIFEIQNEVLQLNASYRSQEDILQDLFRHSGVVYTPIDLSPYVTLLNAKHSPEEYIRGKFILAFFAKIITYTAYNSTNILPSKQKSKDSLGLGCENVISKLCGIMKAPKSLIEFLAVIKESLSRDAA